MIEVEFVFALPEKQFIEKLSFSKQTVTVKEIFQASSMQYEVPQSLHPTEYVFGVFGEVVSQDYQVADGDRVELYRPLKQSPEEARLQRNALKKK